ncbi:MAG: putative baseplate assembly protein [Pseudanabaenales cyanobacterium]|nr:putative baseplate assembly protein [Pseudanabaenales cyanobacterium]
MTLPLPQLDNRTFAQLVEEAQKLIPRYAPEWTDYNIHDPGITVIELFAWLSELQRYYLDQVREDNSLKFLKLLGIRLKDANPATTDVTFSWVDPQILTPVLVTQGTKLATKEGIVFETDSSVLLVPAELGQVISSSGDGRMDNLDADRLQGLSFYAFGQKAAIGSALYLGFKPLYLFDWDNVPGCEENADTERLKQYLDQYLGISWVKHLDNPAICKLNDGKTIAIGDGDRQLTLDLDEARNRVKLTSATDITDHLYFYVSEDNNQSIYAQPFPAHGTSALTFNLFEDYPVARGRHGEDPVEFIPSVSLSWDYYSLAGYWRSLPVEREETQMFYQSGRLWFNPPIDMAVRNLFPFAAEMYWLRVRVDQAGYELPPKIDSILLNTISATQTDTLREVITYSSHHECIQSFPASYLALKGDNILQVKMPDGCWQDWDGYELDKTDNNQSITIVFRRDIPPAGISNVRVISYLSDSDHRHGLFRSNGLPNQTFSLKPFPIVAKTFQLQVKEKINSNNCWRDWIRVDDFDASHPEDPHYVLDPQQGELWFGDGVNGDIPPASDDGDEYNIRVIACQLVQGGQGNVEANTIQQIYNPAYGLLDPEFVTVENRCAAVGGTAHESLEQGQRRARKELKRIERAVTSEDFEQLALATPGLRVARAQVFLPPEPALSSQVKVVVVPYSETPKPTQPSSGFLQAIHQHLDKHRLITTQVEVIPPSFVEVRVKAVVRIWPEFNPDESRQQIEHFLTQYFLNPLTGGRERKGWPFGRTVYRSEVYQAIENSTAAMDCVENLELQVGDAEEEIEVDRAGNIPIPPHSLIYSTRHQIEIDPGKR